MSKHPLPQSRIITRKAWGALRPEAPRTPSNPDDLLGVVVHWFGSPRQAKNHAGCDDLLRAVQRGHMSGEYIDIAYNMAVCPHGKIYRLRGFRYRSGANGNATVNRQYGAVVYMAGAGDPAPTQTALDALELVIEEYRYLGAGRRVRTHGSITGSACPGPHLTRWVHRKYGT